MSRTDLSAARTGFRQNSTSGASTFSHVNCSRTRPTVSAPLGWSLSGVSLSQIDDEVSQLGGEAELWPTCYGELGHVIDVLNGDNLPAHQAETTACLEQFRRQPPDPSSG